MSQAIVTSYVAPSDRRGSRISVKAYAGRKYYDWDSSLGSDDNHKRAALLYANSAGWLHDDSILVSAGMPKGDGAQVHIFTRDTEYYNRESIASLERFKR